MDAAFDRAQALYDAAEPREIETVEEPSQDELEMMMDEGWMEATDGCHVEPDGACRHGAESWLIALGLI